MFTSGLLYEERFNSLENSNPYQNRSFFTLNRCNNNNIKVLSDEVRKNNDDYFVIMAMNTLKGFYKQGKIDKMVQYLNDKAPGFLAKSPRILFILQKYKFFQYLKKNNLRESENLYKFILFENLKHMSKDWEYKNNFYMYLLKSGNAERQKALDMNFDVYFDRFLSKIQSEIYLYLSKCNHCGQISRDFDSSHCFYEDQNNHADQLYQAYQAQNQEEFEQEFIFDPECEVIERIKKSFEKCDKVEKAKEAKELKEKKEQKPNILETNEHKSIISIAKFENFINNQNIESNKEFINDVKREIRDTISLISTKESMYDNCEESVGSVENRDNESIDEYEYMKNKEIYENNYHFSSANGINLNTNSHNQDETVDTFVIPKPINKIKDLAVIDVSSNFNFYHKPYIPKIPKKYENIKNKVAYLKDFKPKFFKRENIDKKVTRAFRRYLIDASRTSTTIKALLTSFWINFVKENLLPPMNIKCPDTGEMFKFKSFNTSYMIWLFSKKGAKDLYKKYISHKKGEIMDVFKEVVNELSSDTEVVNKQELSNIDDYVSSIHEIYFLPDQPLLDSMVNLSPSTVNSLKDMENKVQQGKKHKALGVERKISNQSTLRNDNSTLQQSCVERCDKEGISVISNSPKLFEEFLEFQEELKHKNPSSIFGEMDLGNELLKKGPFSTRSQDAQDNTNIFDIDFFDKFDESDFSNKPNLLFNFDSSQGMDIDREMPEELYNI